MYNESEKWAFPFQTYVTLTMLQTHTEETQKRVKLMERSLFSARQANLSIFIAYVAVSAFFTHNCGYSFCLGIVLSKRCSPTKRFTKECTISCRNGIIISTIISTFKLIWSVSPCVSKIFLNIFSARFHLLSSYFTPNHYRLCFPITTIYSHKQNAIAFSSVFENNTRSRVRSNEGTRTLRRNICEYGLLAAIAWFAWKLAHPWTQISPSTRKYYTRYK